MAKFLQGELTVPGDKSISHRALMFSLFCQGKSEIKNLSPAADCLSTADCLRQWGVQIIADGQNGSVTVQSPGLKNLHAAQKTLFAGNSGTTMRLMAGIAAGLPFVTSFDGDASLRSRPMSRVLDLLAEMGAKITYGGSKGYAPFTVAGGGLLGKTYKLKVASAQVQTALLLAGLFADGQTSVEVNAPIRDHTQRLFNYLHIPHKSVGDHIVSVSRVSQSLPPFTVDVAGDISSAAFFMVAAALLPGSSVCIRQVGINPGRTLVIDVLRSMGADIKVVDERILCGEPVADIVVAGRGRLRGATITGAEIAQGIDEIPILALAGALCQGVFSVRGAEELRVKESDRIKAIVSNLQAVGASVQEFQDGFDIYGQVALTGGCLWQSFGDHRLAMTGKIAQLVCANPIAIDDDSCIAISYPTFDQHLAQLTHE
jgi:3-phosphoshikimate 1-carboxyvinyltransferase